MLWGYARSSADAQEGIEAGIEARSAACRKDRQKHVSCPWPLELRARGGRSEYRLEVEMDNMCGTLARFGLVIGQSGIFSRIGSAETDELARWFVGNLPRMYLMAWVVSKKHRGGNRSQPGAVMNGIYEFLEKPSTWESCLNSEDNLTLLTKI